MKSRDLKKRIIENFIIYAFHEDSERESMYKILKDYMITEDEGDYNELTQSCNIQEDKLGMHSICGNCGSSTNL